MSDDPLSNPHDLVVRHFLGEIDNMRELVVWQLPQDVLAKLDLDSMKPVKQSFVNKTLRENLSDLVFSVRLTQGGEAFVTLLFEHKSTPDRMCSLQVLRYIVEICDERRRNSVPLSCVIPIVLYHGERPWNVARTLPELIEVPESLVQYIPQFTMHLVDLSQFSDEELRGESVFLAIMMLLKYSRRKELPERLPGILELLRKQLPPARALEGFEAVLRYLVNGTDKISRDKLREVVTHSLKKQGEMIMPTIAEQWIQEGIEKGIEKGELIGRIRTLQGLLKRSVSEQTVLTKLSIGELENMAAELAVLMDDGSE